jgi:hypothetical protein
MPLIQSVQVLKAPLATDEYFQALFKYAQLGKDSIKAQKSVFAGEKGIIEREEEQSVEREDARCNFREFCDDVDLDSTK